MQRRHRGNRRQIRSDTVLRRGESILSRPAKPDTGLPPFCQDQSVVNARGHRAAAGSHENNTARYECSSVAAITTECAKAPGEAFRHSETCTAASAISCGGWGVAIRVPRSKSGGKVIVPTQTPMTRSVTLFMPCQCLDVLHRGMVRAACEALLHMHMAACLTGRNHISGGARVHGPRHGCLRCSGLGHGDRGLKR